MRVCMLQINATDMDEARRFYGEVLDMGIERDYGDVLVLDHDPPMVIHRVEQPARLDYPNMAQTLLVFSVDDLDDTVRRLQQRGVVFVQDRPIQATPGRYIGFRDPFGNVHELLEPANPARPV